MNPLDAKLILDALDKLFAEQDARWDRRFADLDAAWDRRLAPLSSARAMGMQRDDATAFGAGTLEQYGAALAVTADNWGGFFEHHDAAERIHINARPSAVPCDAPLVADNWGGFFEGAVVSSEPDSTAPSITTNNWDGLFEQSAASDAADGADISLALAAPPHPTHRNEFGEEIPRGTDVELDLCDPSARPSSPRTLAVGYCPDSLMEKLHGRVAALVLPDASLAERFPRAADRIRNENGLISSFFDNIRDPCAEDSGADDPVDPGLKFVSQTSFHIRGGTCSTARSDPPDAAVRRAIAIRDDALLATSEALEEQATKEHFAKACAVVLMSCQPCPDDFTNNDHIMDVPMALATDVAPVSVDTRWVFEEIPSRYSTVQHVPFMSSLLLFGAINAPEAQKVFAEVPSTNLVVLEPLLAVDKRPWLPPQEDCTTVLAGSNQVRFDFLSSVSFGLFAVQYRSPWPPPMQQFVTHGDRVQLGPTPWPSFCSYASVAHFTSSLSLVLSDSESRCKRRYVQGDEGSSKDIQSSASYLRLTCSLSHEPFGTSMLISMAAKGSNRDSTLPLNSLARQIELQPWPKWHGHQASQGVTLFCSLAAPVSFASIFVVPTSEIIKEPMTTCSVLLKCGEIAQFDYKSLSDGTDINFWRLIVVNRSVSIVLILSLFQDLAFMLSSGGLVVLICISYLRMSTRDHQLLSNICPVQSKYQLVSTHAPINRHQFGASMVVNLEDCNKLNMHSFELSYILMRQDHRHLYGGISEWYAANTCNQEILAVGDYTTQKFYSIIRQLPTLAGLVYRTYVQATSQATGRFGYLLSKLASFAAS